MNFRNHFYAMGFALICTTAAAQTASDPNEGTRLTRDPTTGIYQFSWWGNNGRTYFLQQSENLADWTYLPVIESGAGQVIGWGSSFSADRSFMRLRYSDLPTSNPFADDFDGDHVSNYDELLQGTDPLSALLDINGLPLDWELFYQVPMGMDASSAAPRGDGLTYMQAFELGLSPKDFYYGLHPAIAKVSGDQQTAGPGSLLPEPLVVNLHDTTSGAPLSNASVTFTVSSGGGALKTSSSAALDTSVVVQTDGGGKARVFFQLPSVTSQTCLVLAAAASGSQQTQVSFTEMSDDGTMPPTASPFAITNFVSQADYDMSCDMTWENHTDNQTQVVIELQRADGSWRVVATLPPGTTSYHMPAQP